MNHVGPYVTDESGQSVDLNFTNPQEVWENYNSDDLFRSAIVLFSGDKSMAISSIHNRLTWDLSNNPSDDEVMSVLGAAIENDESLTAKVKSDFKNLYGVDLTPENLEFAYRNTATIGKSLKGEGEDAARPLFKYDGEFNENNMNLLAFTLCRAVECKGMGKSLQGGMNSGLLRDVKTSFDPEPGNVYFKAPGKDLVSFDQDGQNRPAEPAQVVENTLPKPKWYQKAAATFLPFTKWGKNSQKAINDYNDAEKKHQDSVEQNRKETEELNKWKDSWSAEAEKKYEPNRSKFEAYYENQRDICPANDFTKQKQGVKEIGIGDVKVEGPDMNGIDKPDYTKLRNSINSKNKELDNTKKTTFVPGNK